MSTPSPDATLRGRWLHIARVVWVVVALLYVGVFVFGIPSEFARLSTPCTGPVSCNLQRWAKRLTRVRSWEDESLLRRPP
jgi:hypothetical protein